MQRHHRSPDDYDGGQDDDSQAVEAYAEETELKLAALEGAIRLAECGSTQLTEADRARVRTDADALYAWLTGRILWCSIQSVTEQGSGTEVPVQFTPGGALQLTDTQQFTASVEAKDARGNAVPATLTWSADDGGAVVALAPTADTLSCLFTAVAPGTANYTVTDGTLSASGQVVVTAGAAADLVLTEGAPADQAPAAPAPS